MELVAAMTEALYWRKGYDDSNPDVGMGPSLESLFENVVARSGVRLTEKETERVLQNIRNVK